MSTRRCLALPSALVALAACGPAGTGPDVVVDAVAHDTATQPDTATRPDAEADTGVVDDVADTDALATDAGPADAGDGGGRGDGGACAYRYCEDFEAYSGTITNGMHVGPWIASVGGTGTQMRVDTVRAHEGTHSLHVTVTMGAGANGTLHQAAMAGLVPGNDLFGRAMVYYSNASGNGLPVGVHSWTFNAQGTSTHAAGNVAMNVALTGGQPFLNYHPPAPRTEQSVHGGMVTAGAWHCVQWQYNGSGTTPANVAHVWVDGAAAVNVPASQGWDFATPWSSFDFGFQHYQTLANGVDIYLDEFALDGAMVPCPTP